MAIMLNNIEQHSYWNWLLKVILNSEVLQNCSEKKEARTWPKTWVYINGLVQDCSNSSALAMELLQSCTNSLI